MKDIGGASSECTTGNGMEIRVGHKNWFYFSVLEQLTADCILWKKTTILPGRKRASVFYCASEFI